MRILIADDHVIVRRGIRSILSEDADAETEILEASDGQEAIELARKIKPDIIILDFMMPVMTGIEAARLLKIEMPQVPILILSMHDGNMMAGKLNEIGVQGFVSKTDAVEKLPSAVQTVLAGGTFFGAPAG